MSDIAIKQGRDRIRGPNLAILVKSATQISLNAVSPRIKRTTGVSFVEGLRMADEKNTVIASNARLDHALVGSDEWRSISEVFPCWSGTMTGYEKPGKKLGKFIVYTNPKTNQRCVFPVPEDYKGTKDAILVVEYSDYTLDRDGKDLVVAVQNLENISLVERFPSEAGWYLLDERHGIPTGDEVGHSNYDARYFTRIEEDRSIVVPVARGYDHIFLNDRYGRRGISLFSNPYNRFGVAVEAPRTSE